MEPETFEEEQTSDPERAVIQDYIDRLYAILNELDLTDDREHAMAHRIIDIVSRVQEFHRDLENPPTSETKSPSFTEFFADYLRKKNKPVHGELR